MKVVRLLVSVGFVASFSLGCSGSSPNADLSFVGRQLAGTHGFAVAGHVGTGVDPAVR